MTIEIAKPLVCTTGGFVLPLSLIYIKNKATLKTLKSKEIFMGLLDFLHGGGSMESEAEAYMKQRNREYARKAAEYKRKEAIANMTGQFGGDMQDLLYKNSKNIRKSQALAEKTFGSVGEVARALVKEIENSLAGDISCDIDTKPIANGCGECNNTPNIYDGKEVALFEINTASIKAATRTVTASGKVLRGTFKVGEKVELITPVETRTATIANIIRKGEKAEYANSSSGLVGLVLNGVADVMIRPGYKIAKLKKY